MGDFNMPPGVRVRDIPGYEDEQPQRRCNKCKAFISNQPVTKIETKRYHWCKGKAKVIDCTYTAEYDRGILDIIGWDFEGKTYQIAYSPECGTPSGSIDSDGPQEISVKSIQTWEHDPHWCIESHDWILKYTYQCKKCGNSQEEEVW